VPDKADGLVALFVVRMMVMAEQTRESIIEAAKVAAAQTGGVLSRTEFVRLSGISLHSLYSLFPDGGWSEVQKLSGIRSNKHPPFSDNELLAEYHRVVSVLGTIPTWQKLNSMTSVAMETIKRRFGGLPGTLNAYRSWLESNVPDSPMLAVVNERGSNGTPRQPLPPVAEPKPSTWAKLDGIEYGAPINFRGLRHAPINEQGVVYLFGMVSNELGLIVEAVQTGFPDCEAKRCVNSRENRWQRVRVEFEFRSRNFRDHGHDATKCDLIVCWQHDWPDCPLEVIELRTVIERLDG
jgi:hypothetical protein